MEVLVVFNYHLRNIDQYAVATLEKGTSKELKQEITGAETY